jgi:hypothetical protein
MIAGHADKSGPADYNLELAGERAANVKTYVSGRGIPAARITTQSFGESMPRVPTADGRSRAAEPPRRGHLRPGRGQVVTSPNGTTKGGREAYASRPLLVCAVASALIHQEDAEARPVPATNSAHDQ